MKAAYDIYAGGFHVVDANFDMDLSKPSRYRLYFDAVTRGFIAKLVQWEGSFETKGWMDSNTKATQPEMHKSIAVSKDETEIKEYYYNKDGSFKEYRVSDKYNDRDLRESEKALSDDTTDIMSAALDMMHTVPNTGKCEGSSEIFDGKRRFKMIFINEGQVTLKPSRYNIYHGPASKCVVKVEPMGGDWHKKPRGWMSIQEQGVDHGKLPTLWLAKLEEGAPAVPVKMMVRSGYGAMIMHMTKFESGDKVVLAENQPDEE